MRIFALIFAALLLPTVAWAQPPTYVLAMTWQPAFCELRPDLPECESQTPQRADAVQFSLHGLWPQPRGNAYCGVPDDIRRLDEERRWSDLPSLPLTPATRRALSDAMPGMQSHLDRHEWVKHGTCYGTDAETYFSDSLRLLAAVNQSALGVLFADAVGGRLDADAVHAATELAFGPGAHRRLEIVCRLDGPRRIIVELRLELAGPLDRPLSDAVAQAPNRPAGCDGGEVDAVGPS